METKKAELSFHVSKLEKVVATLDEVLEEPFCTIVRDATIQRFEYCFELSWKALKKALKIEGIEVIRQDRQSEVLLRLDIFRILIFGLKCWRIEI